MPRAENGDEGRARIAALVERFDANRGCYTEAGFDETSTREQFINGFFEALGWDVLDAAGNGPTRDVVFHPRLRDEQGFAGAEEWDEDLTEEELAERGPVARIPNYAFRFLGSTRFFVEAKRRAVAVEARPRDPASPAHLCHGRAGPLRLQQHGQLELFHRHHLEGHAHLPTRLEGKAEDTIGGISQVPRTSQM